MQNEKVDGVIIDLRNNGGGSIAWVDDFDKLHVGPQSAGALPGPAAYGNGGEHITTTDANLALGRINPDYFCGGELTADQSAVARGLDLLSERLQLPPIEIARGIVRLANDNMVNALKLVSLSRGHDLFNPQLLSEGHGVQGAATAKSHQGEFTRVMATA